MKRYQTLLLIPCLLAAFSAHAADDKRASREREMLRRVQQQLQQVEGKIATLEQDKAKLGQDLQAAEQETKRAKSRAWKLDRDLKAEQHKRAVLEKDLELTRKDLAEEKARLADSQKALGGTREKLAETQRSLQVASADKERLEGVKARNEQQIALCEDRNVKLYQIGRDLMVRYDKKTCEDAMKQREPFTGLKQVEVDNLLEEYRDRLDEQRLIKAPGG